VGAEGKGGVKGKQGDRVGFMGRFTEISESVVRGKAFDSRAACTALLEIIEGEPLPFDLHIAFMAQTHVYVRGAALLANRIQPQITLTLTGVAANDVPADPNEPEYSARVRMGGGAVLRLQDQTGTPSRLVINHIRQTAAAQNIPLQLHAQTYDKSASATFGSSVYGTHAATLALPIRYLETPNSLMHLHDLDALINLTRASLQTLSPAILETI
jgi:tetrahedral aminopeptidase